MQSYGNGLANNNSSRPSYLLLISLRYNTGGGAPALSAEEGGGKEDEEAPIRCHPWECRVSSYQASPGNEQDGECLTT